MPYRITCFTVASSLGLTCSTCVAAWLSGSALVSINGNYSTSGPVTTGIVTVCRWVNHLGLWPTTQANSAFYP